MKEGRINTPSNGGITPAASSRASSRLASGASELQIIQSLLSNSNGVRSTQFFDSLTQGLARCFKVKHAFVGRIADEDRKIVEVLAMSDGVEIVRGMQYSLEHTPCAEVMQGKSCFCGDRVQLEYPRDQFLSEFGIRSYFGVPVISQGGDVLGLLSVLHDRPLERSGFLEWTLGTFAKRTALEIENLQKESETSQLISFEKMLASVSTTLVSLPPTGNDLGISRALEIIANFCGGQQACLALFDDQAEKLSVTHEWRAKQFLIERENPAKLEKQKYPYFWSFFERHQSIYISSLARLPTSASAERELLQSEGLRSLLVVPLTTSSGLVGVLALGRLESEQRWGGHSETALRIVGEMFLNLVQRQRASDDLRASERKFRELAENIEEVFWLYDLHLGKHIYISPSFERVWGRRFEELEKLPGQFSETIHPEDRERVTQAFRLQVEGLYSEEYRIVRPDGSLRWVSDKAFPIRNEKGEVFRMAGISHDITDKKKAFIAARENEERFRGYFEQPLVGVAISSTELTVLEVNERACEMLGYGRDELLRASWKDLTHPEDWELSLKEYSKGLSGEVDRYSFEKRYLRKDGSVLHVITSVGWVRKPSSGNPYIISVIQDISRIKAAEAELRMQKDYLQQVIDTNPNMIFVKDSFGRFQLANNSFAEFYHMDREEIIGLTDKDLDIPENLLEGFATSDREVLDTFGTVYTPALKVTDKRGETRWFRSIKTPLLLPDGRTHHVLGVSSEITDIMRIEAEREKLAAEAAVASRLASIGELAAGVAHEINNPLTGMINYAQLVLDQGLSDKSSGYLGEIISEGERIASIVKNLLSFSRTQGPPSSRSDVKLILRAALQLMETQMRKESIVINIEQPSHLPYIKCVPQEIQQVFINLLSNARYALNHKYPKADPGKKLTITTSPIQHGGKEYVRTEFLDLGVGIEKSILEKIFDPFFSTKPADQGTGIGLSISHSIIEKHRGKILFESKHGEFTKVQVDIPVYNSAEGEKSIDGGVG